MVKARFPKPLILVVVSIFFSSSIVFGLGLSNKEFNELKQISLEKEFWEKVKSLDTLTGYFSYLQLVKFNQYREEAKNRIKELAKKLKPVTPEKNQEIKEKIVAISKKGTNVKLNYTTVFGWFLIAENLVICNAGELLLSPEANIQNFSEILWKGAEIKFLDQPDTIYIFYNSNWLQLVE